jgi:hypothetical protein
MAARSPPVSSQDLVLLKNLRPDSLAVLETHFLSNRGEWQRLRAEASCLPWFGKLSLLSLPTELDLAYIVIWKRAFMVRTLLAEQQQADDIEMFLTEWLVDILRVEIRAHIRTRIAEARETMRTRMVYGKTVETVATALLQRRGLVQEVLGLVQPKWPPRRPQGGAITRNELELALRTWFQAMDDWCDTNPRYEQQDKLLIRRRLKAIHRGIEKWRTLANV